MFHVPMRVEATIRTCLVAQACLFYAIELDELVAFNGLYVNAGSEDLHRLPLRM